MKTAICMIVKNEESTVAEWIAYHMAIGFDCAIIFDNASTDQTASVIGQYIGRYDVRRINWALATPEYQVKAYNFALSTFGREFDWMAFVDSDEFVMPLQDQSISQYLDRLPDASALAINWAVFGSSGHIAQPEGLLIENFCHRSETTFGPNRHVKSFVRPAQTIACENPHFFRVKDSYVSETGVPVGWERHGVVDTDPAYQLLRINHYFTKSQEQWAAKINRGYHDIERLASVFSAYDRNEVLDESILRFVPATKAIKEQCS